MVALGTSEDSYSCGGMRRVIKRASRIRISIVILLNGSQIVEFNLGMPLPRVLVLAAPHKGTRV